MYPSWCCFPHELHCSFFQIQCFQGNQESYKMGKDSSISVRLITCKVHAEDAAVVQIVRWVDFYNKPHYSYFQQHGRAMDMVLVPSVWLKNRKTCEGSGQFLHSWPLWMRQREGSGGFDLSASCRLVRRVTFDDKRTQPLSRVIDNLIICSIKALAQVAFAQILPWYDIRENSTYFQYFCNSVKV